MIDIEEVSQEQIDRSVEMAKVGHPMKRLKHRTLGAPAQIRLTGDCSKLSYLSQHWTSKVVADHPKEVLVSEILEIRSGWHTDNFQKASCDRAFTDSVVESRCFSIIFRHPLFLIKAIDLVADTPEIQQAWVIALRYLVDEIKREAHYFNEEKWLQEHFIKADLNNNGSLSFKELWKLLSELNLELSEKYAKTLFKNADFRKSADFFGEDALDFDEFLVFFRSLTQRTEIKTLMSEFSVNKRDYFTPADLKRFIEEVQKFPAISEEECIKLIEKLEPEDPNRDAHILSANGFLKLLLTEYGSAFKAEQDKVFQDMTRPLTEYYIMSSHNTYLIGHQLKGDASVEAYISALKKGVRVLELDIWDGTPEPIVTHGHTLINPIRLRDATKSINDYAFCSSQYPVILSLEVHCTISNQKIIAKIFKEIFADKIYIPPRSEKQIPSPEQLKGKIVMKGWKIPSNVSSDQWCHEDDPEAEDDPLHEAHKIVTDKAADASEQEKTVARALSDLISLQLQPISNIRTDIDNHPHNAIANFSEKKMPDPNSSLYDNYVKYANRHMVRVYPYGLRTDSSNLNPIRFWNAGIQIVTLNVQHADVSNDLADGLFQLNGGAGYILKPECLRLGQLQLSSVKDRFVRLRIELKIISAQYLPRPNTENDIIDPYVVLDVHGLQCDVKTFKTKVVNNNGFNPQWNEEFKIELKAPEFALLRFSVIDYDKLSYDDFVGEYTLPAISLKQGYSFVRLRTGYLHTKDPSAALFIHAKIQSYSDDEISSRFQIQSLSCND